MRGLDKNSWDKNHPGNTWHSTICRGKVTQSIKLLLKSLHREIYIKKVKLYIDLCVNNLSPVRLFPLIFAILL